VSDVLVVVSTSKVSSGRVTPPVIVAPPAVTVRPPVATVTPSVTSRPPFEIVVLPSPRTSNMRVDEDSPASIRLKLVFVAVLAE